MKRFNRRFTGVPRPREPGIWVRETSTQTVTSIAGTTVRQTVADPNNLPQVAGTDQRMTLTRLLLGVAAVIQGTMPAGTLVGDTFVVYLGIYFGSLSESLPNPVLGSSSTVDWLYLQQVAISAPAAGAQIITANLNTIRNLYNQPNLIDIKTKRKVDTDEGVGFVWRAVATDIISGHNPTAVTVSSVITSSQYWKRTMR